jgi:single-strand DNA-binding protein
MDLNKVFIVGRVTAQPELRKTPTGQSVTTFGVATNRVWTDKSGTRQEDVEFHNVVVWGRQAEIASQFLVKGAMVLVEGRLQTRSWQDKQGNTRKNTEIIAERFQLGPRPQGSAVGKRDSKTTEQSSVAEEIPIINVDEEVGPKEDLPF